jgi:hypothetical protein
MILFHSLSYRSHLPVGLLLDFPCCILFFQTPTQSFESSTSSLATWCLNAKTQLTIIKHTYLASPKFSAQLRQICFNSCPQVQGQSPETAVQSFEHVSHFAAKVYSFASFKWLPGAQFLVKHFNFSKNMILACRSQVKVLKLSFFLAGFVLADIPHPYSINSLRRSSPSKKWNYLIALLCCQARTRGQQCRVWVSISLALYNFDQFLIVRALHFFPDLSFITSTFSEIDRLLEKHWPVQF